MIELNPLVLRHSRCDPAEAAPKEEHVCHWYEMTDQINYLPGGMMKGEVTYKAAFHNLPHGLQTHVYAPAGLDLREKWTVCGNAPGEPRVPVEMGSELPREGLYIREDVDMRCNIFLTGFVKKNLNKSHKVVVDRIVEKAAGTFTPTDSDRSGRPQNLQRPDLRQTIHPSSGPSTRWHSAQELPTPARDEIHRELPGCQCPDEHLPTCAMYVDPTRGRYADFQIDHQKPRVSTTRPAVRVPYEQFNYVKLPTPDNEKNINDPELFSGNFHPLSHYHLLFGSNNSDEHDPAVPNTSLALVQAELPASPIRAVTS